MWPDTSEVRSDILDCYFAAQRFDRDLGMLLGLLEKVGGAANNIVVVTGDNGWPFRHGKANLYDAAAERAIAMGSASELEYHLLLAKDLKLITPKNHAELPQRATELKRRLRYSKKLNADR